MRRGWVENLSLFALIYLTSKIYCSSVSWESFIIRLDILTEIAAAEFERLRIFHYSPWYTYAQDGCRPGGVENLSLFALIYLPLLRFAHATGWESFIIRLDILKGKAIAANPWLRIFHYSPWYTYWVGWWARLLVENLSLFALIYLVTRSSRPRPRWESFIIRLDILRPPEYPPGARLRIFHYSPWYT